MLGIIIIIIIIIIAVSLVKSPASHIAQKTSTPTLLRVKSRSDINFSTYAIQNACRASSELSHTSQSVDGERWEASDGGIITHASISE